MSEREHEPETPAGGSLSVRNDKQDKPEAPAREHKGWSDERVEQIVGNLLRLGVMAAAAVVAVGGAFYLYREGGRPYREHHVFSSEPPQLRRPLDILDAAARGDSDAIIACGLLLLIATPILRVVFSAIAFAGQRDRTYVVVTLVVLCVLMYSLFSGHLH
jgi:uncharacterized membrane protein